MTQGTLANQDLSTVIRPTLDGLAEFDGHVVVSTGNVPVESVGPIPANAHVAEFLPYDLLLPRLDALVSNGGYGTVLLALRHGVPIVVAPGAEDKPEVAARVGHFDVGVNLRTSHPTPARIARAVSDVLARREYRARAGALATAIADYDPLESIRVELEALIRTATPDSTA